MGTGNSETASDPKRRILGVEALVPNNSEHERYELRKHLESLEVWRNSTAEPNHGNKKAVSRHRLQFHSLE